MSKFFFRKGKVSTFLLRLRLFQYFGKNAYRFFQYGVPESHHFFPKPPSFESKFMLNILKEHHFTWRFGLFKPFSFYSGNASLFFNIFKYGVPFLSPEKLMFIRRISFFEK